jgi:uncharacterized membrane protein SirB2
MSEYYLPLRYLHIGSAIISTVLFIARGVLMLAGANMHRGRALRTVPHAIDTVLLASAILLTLSISQFPFVDGWLTAKAVLLVVYIVLGSIALKRGRSRPVRQFAFAAAVLTVLFLFSVAHARDPMGFFAG